MLAVYLLCENGLCNYKKIEPSLSLVAGLWAESSTYVNGDTEKQSTTPSCNHQKYEY